MGSVRLNNTPHAVQPVFYPDLVSISGSNSEPKDSYADFDSV